MNRISAGPMLRLQRFVLTALLCCLAIPATGEVDPLDWPNWRGPQQNSISTETGLVDHWDPSGGDGSNLVWKNTALAGRSSPIVIRGKLYTIVRDEAGTANEREKVVCADAATGDILWEHRFNVYLSDVPDIRVGWSSCVADPQTGRIYALGVCGYFCCLEGDSGKVVWDRSLHEEFGLISTFGGRTNVPVIFEDTVLISAVVVGWGDEAKWGNLAKPAHRFLSFDKATGELRWLDGTRIGPYDTTYSTPMVTTLGGVAALVFGSGDGGLWALQPRTGKSLWHYPLSSRGTNVSPLVAPDGRVYMSHSEENVVGSTMGLVVALDGTRRGDLTGTELWTKYEIMAGKSSPLLVDGRLYVVDDRAKLFIFDYATGEQIARKALGTVMRSTPVYADGKLYLCTSGGRWYILKPTEDGVEIVHRLRLSGESVSGSPAVSHGRIYLPTSETMYCIGDPSAQPLARPLPPNPLDREVTSDLKPSVVQVVPYDTLLPPGGEQAYRVRLYNAEGQFLREVPTGEVAFDVDGPGSITSDGRFVAAADAGHQCALVTCQVDDLTGSARVRVVPPLPWEFDFNDADLAPLTWIGGRVRWVVREQDGEVFIAKRDVLPTPRDPYNKLGTRSYLYMGPIDLADYTIQADIQLTEKNGRRPDVGIINSRYTLTIRSGDRQLRLYSWSPSDFRAFKSVDFKAEPGVWYTLKLSVVPQQTEVAVLGKIWQRGEAEPNDWTIRMVDTAPNLHGSPGVYGNSGETEIYLDNLSVTPN